jgi:hypothetical protein
MNQDEYKVLHSEPHKQGASKNEDPWIQPQIEYNGGFVDLV